MRWSENGNSLLNLDMRDVVCWLRISPFKSKEDKKAVKDYLVGFMNGFSEKAAEEMAKCCDQISFLKNL
jgi:hypothetical protein